MNKGINYKPREGEGSDLSVNSKPTTFIEESFFFFSGNDTDLPGICRKSTTTWKSGVYRLKYNYFASGSQSLSYLKIVPDSCKALCILHFPPVDSTL